MSIIKKIVRPIVNGMYSDSYDVEYEMKNGRIFWRTYTIRGEMIQKHFDFIMTHPVRAVYSAWGHRHIHDVWEDASNGD